MNEKQLKTIVSEYGTPTYVYDIGKLMQRIKYIKKQLPEEVDICYAIKANTFVVKELENQVDRFEVCSLGEYKVCKKRGIDEDKILISGVNKSKDEIEYIINNSKIRLFSIESISQFELIKNLKEDLKIVIRLTSGNQFGINKEDIEQIIKEVKKYPNIEIEGIQYFSGTQKTSIKVLKKELELLDEFIIELKEKYGYEAKILEYGTGFPVNYFEGKEFDEEEFFSEFSSILKTLQYKGKIILEVGRSIVASCGYYVTKVIDKKVNNGQNYAIVDGGINHLVYYGQSMAMRLPYMKLYPSRENSEMEKWNIFGSLCTINDILVKQLNAKIDIGDVLVFENTGAYCSTEGISLFLSRDLPSVVKINEDESIELIRTHKSTYELNC